MSIKMSEFHYQLGCFLLLWWSYVLNSLTGSAKCTVQWSLIIELAAEQEVKSLSTDLFVVPHVLLHFVH